MTVCLTILNMGLIVHTIFTYQIPLSSKWNRCCARMWGHGVELLVDMFFEPRARLTVLQLQ